MPRCCARIRTSAASVSWRRGRRMRISPCRCWIWRGCAERRCGSAIVCWRPWGSPWTIQKRPAVCWCGATRSSSSISSTTCSATAPEATTGDRAPSPCGWSWWGTTLWSWWTTAASVSHRPSCAPSSTWKRTCPVCTPSAWGCPWGGRSPTTTGVVCSCWPNRRGAERCSPCPPCSLTFTGDRSSDGQAVD